MSLVLTGKELVEKVIAHHGEPFHQFLTEFGYTGSLYDGQVFLADDDSYLDAEEQQKISDAREIYAAEVESNFPSAGNPYTRLLSYASTDDVALSFRCIMNLGRSIQEDYDHI